MNAIWKAPPTACATPKHYALRFETKQNKNAKIKQAAFRRRTELEAKKCSNITSVIWNWWGWTRLTLMSDVCFLSQTADLFGQCFRFNKRTCLHVGWSKANTCIHSTTRLKARSFTLFICDAVRNHAVLTSLRTRGRNSDLRR